MSDEHILVMDRVVEELRVFDDRFGKFMEGLEVCYHQGKVPRELHDEAIWLKEKTADLLTWASDWKELAEMNGVDLGE